MIHFNTFQYNEYASSKKSKRSTKRSGFYADIEFLNENLFVTSENSVRYQTFQGKFLNILCGENTLFILVLQWQEKYNL